MGIDVSGFFSFKLSFEGCPGVDLGLCDQFVGISSFSFKQKLGHIIEGLMLMPYMC